MSKEDLGKALHEVFHAVQESKIPTALTLTNLLYMDEGYFSAEDLPMLEQILREEYDLKEMDSIDEVSQLVGGREDINLYVFRAKEGQIMYYLNPREVD